MSLEQLQINKNTTTAQTIANEHKTTAARSKYLNMISALIFDPKICSYIYQSLLSTQQVKNQLQALAAVIHTAQL